MDTMILLRRVHHAFQRIDATKAHRNLVAGELLEAFRRLTADQEIARRLFLLLRPLLLLFDLGLRCLLLLRKL
jgi:hypothetical protein